MNHRFTFNEEEHTAGAIEAAYRRGYRDGYVAALQAVYGDRGIPAHLWAFWQDTLLEWQKRSQDTTELPPVAPKKVTL